MGATAAASGAVSGAAFAVADADAEGAGGTGAPTPEMGWSRNEGVIVTAPLAAVGASLPAFLADAS